MKKQFAIVISNGLLCNRESDKKLTNRQNARIAKVDERMKVLHRRLRMPYSNEVYIGNWPYANVVFSTVPINDSMCDRLFDSQSENADGVKDNPVPKGWEFKEVSLNLWNTIRRWK